MIRLILQVFCALFSGFMEAMAISNEIMPAGSPLLALFCLVPLYIALYRAKSCSESFWLMFLQTLVVHLISSFWLANFHDFAIFTLGASALGSASMGGLCGIVIYLYPSHGSSSLKLEEAGGRHPYAPFLRMLWFSSAWVFWEWIKSTGFLAYPWGTLSMAAYSWKILTQISSVTGVWGITFIYALFNALVAEGIFLFQSRSYAQSFRSMLTTYRTQAVFVLVVFGCTTVYGLYEYFIPRVPIKSLNTVIVQQNIDPWEGGEGSSIAISKRLTEEKVQELATNGKKADLVLWSEGVLNHQYPNARYYYSQTPAEESLSDFIKRMGVPFIMGGEATLNQSRRHFGNAAVFYDKNGEYAGFYCKMHLVPFAEVIPYADNPLMQAFLKKIVGFSSGWTPGKQFVLFQIPIQSGRQTATALEYRTNTYTVLPLNSDGSSNPQVTSTYINNNDVNPDTTVCFTTPICFEDAFPDVCSRLYRMGSEVFMNITNDSWSATNSAEYQHFIAASYLAIEYRTTLVRCANAGYSVVVDPSGRIIADLPVFTESALATAVPVYAREATVYAQYGDWFAYVCFIFMGCFVIYYFWLLWFKRDDDDIKYITITIGRKETATEQNEAPAPAVQQAEYTSAREPIMQAEKATVAAKKAAAPARKAAPAKKATVPAKKAAVPAKRATAPARKAAPAKKAASSSRKAAAPAKKATSSAKKATAPAKKTTSSVKKTSAPAKKQPRRK
jgi:apolipoprotein N-acyltransferase